MAFNAPSQFINGVASWHTGQSPPNSDAVKTKAVQRVGDARLQIFRATTRRIRLGDETGNFARHIRQRGQFAEVPPPRIKLPVTDGRLGTMVEDEKNFRTAPDQFNHRRQLVMHDAKVKGKTKFRQRVDARDEIWAQTKTGLRFTLQISADAFDERIFCKRRQFAGHSGSQFNRSLRDNSFQPGFARGEFGNPIDLVKALRSNATAFDENHFADVRSFGGR